MCPTPQVEVVTFADELHPLQTAAVNFFYNTISLKKSCQGLFEVRCKLDQLVKFAPPSNSPWQLFPYDFPLQKKIPAAV